MTTSSDPAAPSIRNRPAEAPAAPGEYAAGPGAVPLPRRVFAEALGTGSLVTVVIGSGIMAARLSPHDAGLQLLMNSTTTALALTVLIIWLGPVSGAHFNPAVSLADWFVHRRRTTGLNARELAAYVTAQTAGAAGGAILANLMFALPAVALSQHERAQPHLWLGEVVATAGLIAVVLTLARTGRAALAAPTIGAYIGAAYWFTSSTSFANPAVTAGRALSDTFAGIAPASVPGFVAAQLAGAVIGVLLLAVLYPSAGAAADGAERAAEPARRPARP
ncbi:aquaporin [Actinomadura sp. 9N215]|uniref:aquaporin n=1 Tax=Actinomadura sp. 9N215 TaxID=3375150 RepID=UPI0037B7C631